MTIEELEAQQEPYDTSIDDPDADAYWWYLEGMKDTLRGIHFDAFSQEEAWLRDIYLQGKQDISPELEEQLREQEFLGRLQ